VIDEIQLCADPERGMSSPTGCCTARRGRNALLGSDTCAAVIQRFFQSLVYQPGAVSDLAYTGAKKLTRCPAAVRWLVSRRRCLRHCRSDPPQRGGAAVVLGALFAPHRNAQVELYQSGDVDFLVATDAIGMGLNMDVIMWRLRHARNSTARGCAPLAPQEIGQIAGRAGRYMNDGTFGVTGRLRAIRDETVAGGSHRSDPVRVLHGAMPIWISARLTSLNDSLDMPPPERGWRGRAPPAMRWR